MANKYLSLNNLPIGFVILMCVLFIYKYFEVYSQDNFPIIVDNTEDFVEMNRFKGKARSIAEIKEFINRHNEDPAIGKNIRQNSMRGKYYAVVVIEVRSNTFFFESLIQSLKAVTGINRALLIFSHETYDDDINEIVKKINFTTYIQIFYPYSIQLHPKVFPGDDLKFCRDNLSCENNNGRRNVTATQRKNHCWWTLNYVFDHLRPLDQHNKTFVFLEHDQYVAKDFIYIVKMLELMQPTYCPHCMIFSLAIIKPNLTNYNQNPTITIKEVGSTQELMGIGFNRSGWTEIKGLSDYYCSFNDVDWTRSLVYSLRKTPNRTYLMLTIDGPRVYRFDIRPSVCCGDTDMIDMKQTFMSKNNRHFPKHEIVRSYDERITLNASTGHGGWEDARDHGLCKYFTRSVTNE